MRRWTRKISRSFVPGLGWLARQIRDEVAITVSLGHQATSEPCVKHLLMMNKCIEKCKLDPDYTAVFNRDRGLVKECKLDRRRR